MPPRDTYTYAISVGNPSTDDVATVRIWDKRNGNATMLDDGEMVELDDMGDFYVSANEPISMAGYMLGCSAAGNPRVGDPYMVQMVSVEQHLDDYVFLIDDSYTQDS